MIKKILRWIGYASTFVGAVLIIWAVVGGIHNCCHSHKADKSTCSAMQHPNCTPGMAKMDTVNGKEHPKCCAASSKMDSAKCMKQSNCSMKCSKDEMCCSGHRPFNGGYRHHHVNLFNAAISFLVLAIALLMISNNCCCNSKCCDSKEEQKET